MSPMSPNMHQIGCSSKFLLTPELRECSISKITDQYSIPATNRYTYIYIERFTNSYQWQLFWAKSQADSSPHTVADPTLLAVPARYQASDMAERLQGDGSDPKNVGKTKQQFHHIFVASIFHHFPIKKHVNLWDPSSSDPRRDPFHLTFEGLTPHKQSCRSLALGKSCASCARPGTWRKIQVTSGYLKTRS